MDDNCLMEFTSHVSGKNAHVFVYSDRIEWKRESVGGTPGKIALGALTGGLSLLATGIQGRKDTAMIPVKMITGVSTSRDKLRTVVNVRTSSDTIAFRCSAAVAKEFQTIVGQLILSQ